MQSFSPPPPPDYDPQNPWRFPAQRLVDVMDHLRAALKSHLDRWSQTHSYPDQRFVVFQELYGAATIGHIQAVFYRDHASDKSWWESHPELAVKAHQRVIPMVNLSLREGLQTYLMELCASKWKDAMLQTAQYFGFGTIEAGPWSSDGNNRIEQLWAELELFEWIPLIQLVEHTRNAAFYNGKFCHPQKLDATIAYKQWTFHFLHGMEVNKPPQWVDDWDLYIFVIQEMARSLEAVFRCESVQGIEKIDSPHLT